MSLGTPELVRLYGSDQVNAIAGILNDQITSSRLVELLNIKFGNQILADKSVRRKIYETLSHENLGYILDGKKIDNRALTADEAGKLYNLSWGRTKNSSKRMLELLDLNVGYLPPELIRAPESEFISPGIFLYPHQLHLKDRLVRLLTDGESRVLVHMPTGAGKTRTAIEGIIDYWKASGDRSKNIFWLAHSEELCEQAVETFKKIWLARGDKDIQIKRLWGSHSVSEVPTDGAIIVAGFQKLYSMVSSAEDHTFELISQLRRKSAIVVVDEAHKAIAPTYKICTEFLISPDETKLIGLTATPGRGTEDVFEIGGGQTAELADFFNNKKLGLVDEGGKDLEDPISYLQKLGFLSSIVRKKITTSTNVELSEKEQKFVADFLELPQSVLKKLEADEERNALILGEVGALYVQEKQIIVFALSVSHARLINDLLNLKGVPSRCIDGQTPEVERQESINDYKEGKIRVLVNYGVLTTGFDAPNTNAILIARPTASLVLYSQMIGRGIRGKKVGGNLECTLVDVKDNMVGFPSEQLAFSHFDTIWS